MLKIRDSKNTSKLPLSKIKKNNYQQQKKQCKIKFDIQCKNIKCKSQQ